MPKHHRLLTTKPVSPNQYTGVAMEHTVFGLLMTGGLTPIRSSFEDLHGPDDLGEWLSSVVLDGTRVAPSRSDLESAIALREAIFQTIRHKTKGAPLGKQDLETINRVAHAAPLVPAMAAGTAKRVWAKPPTARAALSTIARDAIELLTGPLADRVRECANPKCELVFVDSSPPGRRRWCSMDRCGNRAKTRAYRRRRERQNR